MMHVEEKTKKKLTAIERQYFAVNFKLARKSLKLSQDEVAQRAGVQQRYISKVEAGESNVGIDVLSLLSRSVNKEVYELLMPLEGAQQ